MVIINSLANSKLHTFAVVFISPKDENDAVIKRVIATEHQVIQTRYDKILKKPISFRFKYTPLFEISQTLILFL